ncbi:hypothetical protein L6452_39337 [Arctium lappa]|uniref:Uncharacterized protein n=1 Tax=Arctium lappa TaxID=4217 RepID=A0ACB8XS09_ARCLA|nr:hypothetical protein L6452_39337 [Arctium lappa]
MRTMKKTHNFRNIALGLSHENPKILFLMASYGSSTPVGFSGVTTGDVPVSTSVDRGIIPPEMSLSLSLRLASQALQPPSLANLGFSRRA